MLCGERKNDIADIDHVLSQFSDRKGAARRKYDLFVRDRLAQGHRDDFYKTKDQRFLGDDEYLEDVERHIHQTLPFTYEIGLEEIVSQVGSALKIPIELLYSSSRSRQGAWGRAVCAYIGHGLGGFKLREIAEHFNRDPVAMTYGFRKVEERLREDKKLEVEVSGLENSLIRNKRRKIKT